MDPLTGILLMCNVGASAFNNWRNSAQAKKLQQKQQEYAYAVAERNGQRMWNLMREGQDLSIEMEQDAHETRLKEINEDFDNVLNRLAYTEAIKLWPLKVLPIVMKNQSLGNVLVNKNENIAIHCILTPSNCRKFNAKVFSEIEQNVSNFCNEHWNTLSSHPILFYSGAWQSGTAPTGIEIDQLKVNLHNLPTLMITPYFKPNGGLVFLLNVWGIGMDDVSAELECKDFSYSECYVKDMDYDNDEDLSRNTIDELVSYIECIIGYIADLYFWTSHNEAPIFPFLLEKNVVNTDGMPYLRKASKDRYETLLDVFKEESNEMPFAPEKMLRLLEGSTPLWSDVDCKQKLEEFLRPYYNEMSLCENANLELLMKEYPWSHYDKNILFCIKSICLKDKKICDIIDEIIVKLESSNEWIIEERLMFTNKDFEKWIESNQSLFDKSAKYAILLQRDCFYAMMVVDERGECIPIKKGLGGICVVAHRSYIPANIVKNKVIVYDLKLKEYSNNNFMEGNKFNSFERLGKQLDSLINNLGRIPKSIINKNGEDYNQGASMVKIEQQLIDIFMKNPDLGIEMETIAVAKFEDIKSWINSKMPVPNATKVHVFRKKESTGMLICVFFTDKDMNLLIGNGYPSKRIICETCDSDIEAFFNGLSIGTITL